MSVKLVPEKSYYETTTQFDKVLICKLCGSLVFLDNQYLHLDFHGLTYRRTKDRNCLS